MSTGHIDATILANIDANTQNQTVLDPVKIKAFYDELATKNDGNYDLFIADYNAALGINRQAIINGGFDVWQRGTSFTNPSSFSYTADRWMYQYDGTGQQHTVSQQAFTVGQTDVPNEPKYFWRLQVTTAATGQTFNVLDHRIESVRTFAGQKITISFYAKANASCTLNVKAGQNFGSGGSSAVYSADNLLSIGTTWAKYTVTITMPSISGKTIGTSDYLDIQILMPINTLMTIDVAQVQLNAGDTALSFQPRSFAEELALCERYYEKTYDYGTAPGTATNLGQVGLASSGTDSTGNIIQKFEFNTRKRVAPTITVYDSAGSSGKVTKVQSNGTATDGIVPSVGNQSENSFQVYINSTAAAGFACHYTADAEI